MHYRARNWLIALGAFLAFWFLQPFFARNLEAVMERYHWDQIGNDLIDGLPNWTEAVSDWLPSGFWAGAFTVLLLWGLLEAVYAWRRRGGEVVTSSAPATSEQRTILKALDALFVEGTKHMNRLIPPIQGYNDKSERETLHEWQGQVLGKMEEANVSVPIMSRFTTFYKFDPTFHRIAGKGAQQELLEGIWDEKLRQLRIIIDSFDNPRKA